MMVCRRESFNSHVPSPATVGSAAANTFCSSIAPFRSPSFHRLYISTCALGKRLPRPVMSFFRQLYSTPPPFLFLLRYRRRHRDGTREEKTYTTTPANQRCQEMVTLSPHRVKLFHRPRARRAVKLAHVAAGQLAADNVGMLG